TAIPAFIGYTEKARDRTDGDLIGKGKRISSMVEYVQYFGAAKAEAGLVVTVSGAPGKMEIQGSIDPEKQSKFLMFYSLQMFFANGGGPCYIIPVADYQATGDVIAVTKLKDGLKVVEKIDEVTLIVFPDSINLDTS